MKKNIFVLSTLAVAALALVSCAKEQDFSTKEESKGVPFEIIASSIDSKTINDDMSTLWEAGDKINLFHAVNGETTYVNDGAFEATADGKSVKFTGTLASALTSGNYDWFAVYPYNANFDSPGGTCTVDFPDLQFQDGNDSMAHLVGENCPVAGNGKDVAYDATPTVAFKHLSSIIKVHVTNKTASPITVEDVIFTAPDFKISGKFNLDLSGTSPKLDEDPAFSNNYVQLKVTGGAEIAPDASADFYLAVKNFAVKAGDELMLNVTANSQQYDMMTIMPSNYTFAAGKIATLNFNYTNKGYSFAKFLYEDSDWLDAQGITKPAASEGTKVDGTYQKVRNIYVAPQKKTGSDPMLWNNSGNFELRIYNNNKLVIGAFDNKIITKVTFVGGVPTTADVGTLNADARTWTGRAGKIEFGQTARKDIKSVNVFFEEAEATDHELVVPTTAFSTAYTAGSVEVPIFVVNAEGLTATSSSDGFISATPSVANGVVTVKYSANASTSPRNIVVNISSTNPAVSTEVTITQSGYPVTTIAGIKGLYSDAAVPFTATLTDALVTLVSGNTFFMEDASGGIKGNFSGHGLSAGDKISGTVTGTVNKTSGNYVFTALDKSVATITTGNTVTPTTVSASTLSDNFASYESKFVKVEAVEVSAVSGKNLTLDGISGFIVYNNSDLALPVGSQFNAVGPATYYNATKEIAIYSVEDADRISIVPTITADNTSVVVGGTETISLTVNSTGAVTFTSLNTDKATVNDSGVITGVAAGEATIRISVAANGYWAAASKDITVTVTATAKKYTKVTSITSGKTYLIVNAAQGVMMPHPGSSGAKLDKQDVTITSNQITQTAATMACEFVITTETIESTSVNLVSYTESSTTYYLRGYSSGTNLGRDSSKPSVLDNSCIWNISTPDTGKEYGGSFKFLNRKRSSASLIYRAGTSYQFGVYADSNLNGTEYNNVDLFELED